jgi:PAS domain S-box-containing protein
MTDNRSTGTDESEGVIQGVLRTITPTFLRRKYARKFLATFLLVVVIISLIGAVNLIQIRETTESEANDELRSQASFRASLQNQWVGSMETQTQLVSADVDPESLRGRFSTLSLADAPWQSSASIVAVHYVNVSQNTLVASTRLNYSDRALDSIDAPWVDILNRVELSEHRNSTVWLTDTSYLQDETRVVGFVSPAAAEGDAVVVAGSNQPVLEELNGSQQQTTVLNADGERVFGAAFEPTDSALEAFRTARDSDSIQLVDDGSSIRAYAPVRETEWLVLTSAEKSSAFQAVRAVQQNLIWNVVTTVLVLIGVGFVFGRHTVVPLVKLRRRTQEIADRNFDIDLSTNRIDEIGRLYEDFGLMRDALQRQIREIEDHEAELEELTTRFQLALEESDTGIWEWNPETDVVVWDEASEQLFGYEPGAFPGTYEAFIDRVHPDDVETVETQIAGAIENDEEYRADFRIQLPDGSQRWIGARGVVEHEDGDVARILGIQTDITERKEREQELEEYRDQLEQSNRKLEQFAYVASHDLQEPLRMVSSYMDLLEMELGDELDEETQEYMEFAVDGAERMQAMIDGLLEFSRVQTQANPFDEVDVDEVLADTRQDLALKIEESDADLEVGDLPTVEADGDQLGQVFQNLIKNAIEHGDENTVVEVSATRTDDATKFAVTDNGPGIPEHRQADIFDIFDKGADSSGTGIGLAVCQQIVDRHGGDIWVESTEGEGTTFYFTIPDEPG